MNTLDTQGYIVRPRVPKEVIEALETLGATDEVPFSYFPLCIRTLIRESHHTGRDPGAGRVWAQPPRHTV